MNSRARRVFFVVIALVGLSTLLVYCLSVFAPSIREDILLKELRSQDEYRRKAAAETLAGLRSKKALPELLLLYLEIPYWDADKHHITSALCRYGLEVVPPALELCFAKDQAPEPGISLGILLRRIGVTNQELVVIGGGMENPQARAFAMDICLSTEVKATEPVKATVERLMKDQDAQVRDAAAKAFEELFGR